jgi:hypothetical protein
VKLVPNDTYGLDEGIRQGILLAAARRIAESSLIVALDADELLSAEATDRHAWATSLAAPRGTLVKFRLANLLDGGTSFWYEHMATHFAVAFMDDGRPVQDGNIHQPRVPVSSDDPVLLEDEITVIHLQYLDWERMKRKQRWYQCWERIKHPERRAVDIYRQYHHMDAARKNPMRPVPGKWLEAYENCGIRLSKVHLDGSGWWDDDVMQWVTEFGPDYFRRVDIWDLPVHGQPLPDPRTRGEKVIMWWLKRTQGRDESEIARRAESLLRKHGW